MQNYLENRLQQVKDIHNIYCPNIPDFIKELLAAPALIRLHGVGQHCGTEYVKIPMFKHDYFYSRLDHSLGVALILWNFTQDKEQVISGLFHDISSTVFAHVGDFMKKDYINQEETESETTNIIKKSSIIINKLKEWDIKIDRIDNYKLYPLADNKGPQLCADRLECTLHYPHFRGVWYTSDIQQVYDKIVILKNEDELHELGFSDVDMAIKATEISIENGKIDSANPTKLVMQFLADILIKAINNKIISEEDLYCISEQQVIEKLETCNEDSIRNAWEYYSTFTQVKTSKKPVTNKYCINFDVKRRYIDPLVKTQTGVYRVSEISKDLKKKIDIFRENKDLEYVYIDFDF